MIVGVGINVLVVIAPRDIKIGRREQVQARELDVSRPFDLPVEMDLYSLSNIVVFAHY